MTENKKMTSLMLGAGVLATAALATQPTNKAEAATTRKVAYTEGATTVWTSPTVGQQVTRYLLPHQSVNFVKSQQVYGDKWLQTTDGGWVPERYLSPVASTTTTKTTKSASKPVIGTLTANYDQGATTVWQGVNFLNVKGYLATGNQASYVATQQANGHTWYQLANGGWVLDSFVSTGRSAKPAAKTTTPAASTNTTTSAQTTTNNKTSTATQSQTTNQSAATTNQSTTTTNQSTSTQNTTASQARPQTNTTTQNTTTQNTTTTPKATTPAAPKVTTPAAKPAVGTLTVTYTSGSTTVWQNESFSQVKGYLSANQKVSYTAKKQVNGATVYQLTNGGWVNGQYVTTGSHTVNTNQSSQSNTNTSTSTNHTTNTAVNKPAATPTPSRPTTTSGIGVAIANQAKKYLGVPYVWGGTSPAGFDCSGLIYYAAQQVGYNIGVRTSQAMSTLGQYVSINNIQPGDLLFWGGVGTAHHVAIYLGNNQFVQAPTVGDHVRITNMNYYRPDFARRL